MENTELQKLANCITFSGSRGREEFKEDIKIFIQQVKEKTTGYYCGIGMYLLLQGKQGVGKSTLAKRLAHNCTFTSQEGLYKKEGSLALTENLIVEFSGLSYDQIEGGLLKNLTSATDVLIRKPYTDDLKYYRVIGSVIVTTNIEPFQERGRRRMPFIIEKINFEALNAIDFQKIYQSI